MLEQRDGDPPCCPERDARLGCAERTGLRLEAMEDIYRRFHGPAAQRQVPAPYERTRGHQRLTLEVTDLQFARDRLQVRGIETRVVEPSHERHRALCPFPTERVTRAGGHEAVVLDLDPSGLARMLDQRAGRFSAEAERREDGDGGPQVRAP